MSIQKEESQSFKAYQEVSKAIQPYIEGAKTGNGEGIRSVFYDHAHVVGSMDGQFVNYTTDQFAEAVGSLGPSEKVQHHIAWIDISGPAAAAKIEFVDWLGFRFTDFLSSTKPMESGRLVERSTIPILGIDGVRVLVSNKKRMARQ